MKHLKKFAVMLFIIASGTTFASGQRSLSGGDFSDVANRDWRLAEIRSAGKTVTINRTPPVSFATIDLSEWFSIRFQDGQAGGMAAPNRYGAPYTQADNQAITIGLPRSTMMASFYEPEELKEREYYSHLQNVYRWNLASGNLELYSREADGTETVLVFAPVR